MTVDRRRCVRLATPDLRTGVLVDAEQQWPAEIVDESARGFAIRLALGSHFDVDQVLALETPGGWSQVRVARVETLPEALELGLERLRDFGKVVASPRQARRLCVPGLRYTPMILTAIAGLFVLGAVGGTLVFDTYFDVPTQSGTARPRGEVEIQSGSPGREQRRRTRTGTNAGGSGEGAASAAAEKVGDSANAAFDAARRAASGAADVAGEVSDQIQPSAEALARLTKLPADSLNGWRRELQTLPWRTSALLDLVSINLAHLGLSELQQAQISAIIRRAVGELKTLAERFGGNSESLRTARRIENRAVNDIAAQFTRRQREQWQALSHENAAAAPGP